MPIKVTKVFLVKLKSILTELVDSIKHVEAGVIATPDGMVLVASDSDKEKQEKLAAMSSSLCSLGEAVVKEVSQGSCLSVTVEADNTKIFVLRLTKAPGLILMLVANREALVGEIVYAAKRFGAEVKEIITGMNKK